MTSETTRIKRHDTSALAAEAMREARLQILLAGLFILSVAAFCGVLGAQNAEERAARQATIERV